MKRFREREILKLPTHADEKGKQHWSSGDDVRLTRGRSPVQSWDAVLCLSRVQWVLLLILQYAPPVT